MIPEGDIATARPQPPQVNSNHYLYIYDVVAQVEDLIALLDYVATARPVVGRDRWAAFEAEQVTIIGGREDTLELTEFIRALRAAEIQVDHLSAGVAAQLRYGA